MIDIKHKTTGRVLKSIEAASLRGADLRGADLSSAKLRGAELPPAPEIKNIHGVVFAAASQPEALDMGSWHSCDATHCRAGWVVTLAGDEGKALARKIGTNAAAALIYMASDPDLESVPNWYASNEAALADMQVLADREKIVRGIDTEIEEKNS